MKKLILCMLCVLTVLPLVLSGCGKSNGKDDETVPSIKLDYVKDLMVDTEGVTAFGIKREAAATADRKGDETASFSDVMGLFNPLSFFSLTAYAEENEEETEAPRTYLYSTTESFGNGDVEFDETGITKVTFRKNTEKTEEVYDADGKLISEGRVITQDEIPAQINKVYTTEEFTFVQFVALVGKSGFYSYKDENGEIKSEQVELRPDSLRYDEYGVSDFDKTNYYSGALSQSFVISNETGFIYKLEGVTIDGFKNGLVMIDRSYYRVHIKDQDLYLDDVLPNKDVRVANVFKDAYGWVFVANDTINGVDAENKIVYTTDDGLVTDRQYVYETECVEPLYRTHVVKKYEDGEAVDIRQSVQIYDLYYLFDNDFEGHFGCILREWNGITVLQDDERNVSVYDAADEDNYLLFQGWPMDYVNDLYYCLNEQNHLCYRQLSFVGEKEVTLSDPVEISDQTFTKENDYYQTVGNDSYKTLHVFSVKTISGTSYYQVYRIWDALYVRLLDETSYSGQTYIFQPINK